MKPDRRDAFKGNKQSLPTKLCCVCQRPMTWRKSWAKNWQDVKYCSEACRKTRTLKQRPAGT